jgi:hypothetical protein
MYIFIGTIANALISGGLGVHFLTIYLSTKDEGTSVLVAGLGGIFLFSALGGIGYSLKSKFFKTKALTQDTSLTNDFDTGMLQRNNQMVNEYEKISRNRDRLKLLKVSGNADEK